MRDEISRRYARHRAAVPSDVLNEPVAKAGRRTLIPIVAAIAILLGTTGLGVAALNKPTKLPDPVQLSANADAYVSSKSSTQRHGWSSRLVAKKSEASILLRFTVPPVAAGIDRKATLVLHRLTRGTAGTITAATGPSGWTESVSYATAPKAAGTPIATVADDGKSSELRIDVSAAVTEAGVLNLVLTQPEGSNYAVFGSRESGRSESKLEISYLRDSDGPTPSMPTVAPTKLPTKPTTDPHRWPDEADDRADEADHGSDQAHHGADVHADLHPDRRSGLFGLGPAGAVLRRLVRCRGQPAGHRVVGCRPAGLRVDDRPDGRHRALLQLQPEGVPERGHDQARP